MINEVKKQVYELLNSDNSGHGYDHIDRVLKLALKFSKEEDVNVDVVTLIALLHDVDDYKLFGREYADNLINAKNIMNKANVPSNIQKQVLESLKCIGYSKLLKGYRPNSIEGMIVSDADMCDALGVTGILRVYKYSMKNNKPFFNRNIFPISDISAEDYVSRCADSSVCHIFEKILKLKDLMMTDAGKEEAKKRHQIIVDILYHLFDEEDASEWTEYLADYLSKK